MPQNKPDNSFAFTKKPLMSLFTEGGRVKSVSHYLCKLYFLQCIEQADPFLSYRQSPLFDVTFCAGVKNKIEIKSEVESPKSVESGFR